MMIFLGLDESTGCHNVDILSIEIYETCTLALAPTNLFLFSKFLSEIKKITFLYDTLSLHLREKDEQAMAVGLITKSHEAVWGTYIPNLSYPWHEVNT